MASSVVLKDAGFVLGRVPNTSAINCITVDFFHDAPQHRTHSTVNQTIVMQDGLAIIILLTIIGFTFFSSEF